MDIWVEATKGEFVEYLSIPFTRDEWKDILSCIQYTVHYSAAYPDECLSEMNIMDRIEKNLRIE